VLILEEFKIDGWRAFRSAVLKNCFREALFAARLTVRSAYLRARHEYYVWSCRNSKGPVEFSELSDTNRAYFGLPLVGRPRRRKNGPAKGLGD
jgi:hypothetical protein